MRASLLALTCSRLLYADEWFLAVVCVQIPCTRAKCCDSPRSVDWTWACTCARPATGCRPQPRATSWSTSTVNINQFDSAGRSCSCHSHSNLLSSCLVFSRLPWLWPSGGHRPSSQPRGARAQSAHLVDGGQQLDHGVLHRGVAAFHELLGQGRRRTYPLGQQVHAVRRARLHLRRTHGPHHPLVPKVRRRHLPLRGQELARRGRGAHSSLR